MVKIRNIVSSRTHQKLPTTMVLFQRAAKHSKRTTIREILFSYHTLRLLGLLILALSIMYKLHQDTLLSFSSVPQQVRKTHTAEQIYSAPDKIIIESLNIELPITEAVIQSGIWQTSDSGASHLSTSTNPGEPGTVIIYAHNLNKFFGYLPAIQQNAQISIHTKDNKWYVYKVDETKIVNPSQTDILLPTHPQELILYTCYGFADLKRFVVRAVPVN